MHHALGVCFTVLLGVARFLMSASMVAALALFVLYLRLIEGPIALPWLNRIVAEQVTANTDGASLSIGAIQLALGEGDAQSGLEFRDVHVASADEGLPLLDIPRVRARFGMSDLLRGRFQPTAVALIGPQGQFIRTKEGRIRFGMGLGEGLALPSGERAPKTVDQSGALDAISVIIDGFVGDAEPVSSLQKLRRIRVIGAALSYDDRQTGSRWHTDDADLIIARDPGGARATLTLNTETAGAVGPSLRLRADRRTGANETRVIAGFGRLDPAALAPQMPGLDWLSLLQGTAEGQATMVVDGAGAIVALDGEMVIEKGAVSGMGPGLSFDVARIVASIDPVSERLSVTEASISSEMLNARFAGEIDLRRDETGAFAGMAGQLDLGPLYLDAADVFSEPLNFDGGQVTARWRNDEQILEIADARLFRGDLSVQLDGRAMARPQGWLTDLRATGQNASVQDLIAFWPLDAAANARGWVAKSIFEATVDEMIAQIRIGDGEPHLALDFTFRDLSSYYLNKMSPIRQASGRGHMSYHDLYLFMDSGAVESASGPPIQTKGSTVAITDLWGAVTPIDIQINAFGPTAAILGLINEQPLGLVDKLGLDPRSIAGTSQVSARLGFPLLSGLNIADIDVTAQARMAGVRMPFRLGKGQLADVRAEALTLIATTSGMTLAGDITLDGTPLGLDWDENYGVTPGRRTLALKGQITPALLARFGVQDLPITGQAPFKLAVNQVGSGAFAFDLDADLGPAEVVIDALDWRKRAGLGGELLAKGTLDKRLTIDDFALNTDTLKAEGSVALNANGALRRAVLKRVRLERQADVDVIITPGEEGAIDLRVGGRFLDLSGHEDAEDDGEAEADSTGPPVRVQFDIGQLILTEKLALSQAAGLYRRDANGAMNARVEGRLGQSVPVAANITAPAKGPGALTLTASDAGAVLGAADLYPDARGGALRVDAVLGEGKDPAISGTVSIDNIIVRSKDTFRRVLREGGLEAAETEVTSTGIGFSRVRVPFSYAKGMIRLKDAVALSTALGLKINGTINEETRKLDLIGVMSPAYGLTGALDDVPVIGAILSGGKGEGILAMTFSVTGAIDDPSYAVNPLSILAPGFLRKIFTGRSSDVSEGFEERIQRADE